MLAGVAKRVPWRLPGSRSEFILGDFLDMGQQLWITNGVRGATGEDGREQGSNRGRARKKQNREEGEQNAMLFRCSSYQYEKMSPKILINLV